MTKFLKYCMFIFVAVAMASCGDDDKDEPDSPNGNDSAKIYTLELAPGERAELQTPFGADLYFYFEQNRYLEGITVTSSSSGTAPNLAYIGSDMDIKSITEVPSSGWSGQSISGYNNGSYVLEYTAEGKPHYLRMILEFNYGASGQLRGVRGKYQAFVPR